jgi:hypothetical protein
MADVFLSYSQKDRPAIEKVAAGLRTLGLSVWYDARLDSGSAFDEVINAELRDAKAVLVCWSPDSISSKWPRAEAMLGYDKHKLAASFVRPCELTPPFNLVHTSDLSDWTGGQGHPGWQAVIRSIGNLCGRPGVGALAQALAIGSQEAVSAWMRQYPDEPLAKEMWASREAHLRLEFAADMQAARVALAGALDEKRSNAEEALAKSSNAFDTWLEAERTGKPASRLHPTAVVSAAMAADRAAQASLSIEIERLRGELAHSRADVSTATAARDELARKHEQLSGELARRESEWVKPGEVSAGEREMPHFTSARFLLGVCMVAALSGLALIATIGIDRVIPYSTLMGLLGLQVWAFALGSILMIWLIVIGVRRRTLLASILAGGAAAGLPWLLVLTFLSLGRL